MTGRQMSAQGKRDFSRHNLEGWGCLGKKRASVTWVSRNGHVDSLVAMPWRQFPDEQENSVPLKASDGSENTILCSSILSLLESVLK